MNRDKCHVIAEAGVNHNGDPDIAFKLVDAAAKAGADCVKFQTFNAAKLVTKTAGKAEYQNKLTDSAESQYEMLKRLELSVDMHHELISHCKKKNIEFMSTAFDHDSLNFLTGELGLSKLKVSSGDLTNAPFLLAHASVASDLIISTGMATMGEIEEALGVVAYGLLGEKKPSREAFREAYSSTEGKQILREKVTILHCTTEYPAPIDEINLNVINTFKQAFGLRTGYSDHSKGIVVPISAVAIGATLIEKHFTLDKTMEGPDHQSSLEPDELEEMVAAIRDVEIAQGDGIKFPTKSELGNINVARKSIVASKAIEKGQVFSEDNTTVKRPGGGMSPIDYWDLIGKAADRSYEEEEMIK